MTRPEPKGWCPGAHHPMQSGDGLIVRVRPNHARLSAKQALGLSRAAQHFGNGMIDLTSRGNLQIRGVKQTAYDGLMQALKGLTLLDADPAIEARRNILVTPDWTAQDGTVALAQALTQRLGDLPVLPTKFGFSVDSGEAPLLTQASADIRIERSPDGQLLVRADGAPAGRPVTPKTAIEAVLELAHWFADTRKDHPVRMAKLLETNALPDSWTQQVPAITRAALTPGAHPLGYVFGALFGQIDAASLAQLITGSGTSGLRLTPWRLFLAESLKRGGWQGFIDRADAPELNVSACPGLRQCSTASIDTRPLARDLAGLTVASVHVSGCSKGCALPRKAAFTVIGREGKFDLVRDGCSWDQPEYFGLSKTEVLKLASETNDAL